MFKFEMEQKIFNVGGVKLGGQLGELPTVLMGSMFYEGHKIVRDPKLGIFDTEKAKQLVKAQEEMSKKTGNPHMIALEFAPETSAKAVKNYINFVSNVTDAPFLIGGYPRARIDALEYVAEIGLVDRAVYDSITYMIKEDELKAIEKAGLKAAVIQAFNPENPRPKGQIRVLEEGMRRGRMKEGLLKVASNVGVEKILISTPALDVAGLGHITARPIYMIKNKFGLPCGAPPVGIMGSWFKERKAGEFGIDILKACRACATSLVQFMGADFIIYGSISKSKHIFPPCALIDAIIVFDAKNSFNVKPLTRDHPVFKMLR